MPSRIQRSRTRGWRMPAGAIYVGRPTHWGNPFIIRDFGGGPIVIGPDKVGHLFVEDPSLAAARGLARDLYREWIKTWPSYRVHQIVELLRGHDLACWCHLCAEHRKGKAIGILCSDCDPCHADVLLELANA